MCDLLLECVDGKVISTTGVLHLLIFLGAFALIALALLAGERKSSTGDTPLPIGIALFLAGSTALIIAILSYPLGLLIIDQPKDLIISATAISITVIIVILSLLIRRYRWK